MAHPNWTVVGATTAGDAGWAAGAGEAGAGGAGAGRAGASVAGSKPGGVSGMVEDGIPGANEPLGVVCRAVGSSIAPIVVRSA